MANTAYNSGWMRGNELQNHRIEDQIRRRAYELYAARGHRDGNDIDDWLQAESELVPGKRNAKAA